MRVKKFFLVIYCSVFLTNIGIVLGDGKVFVQRYSDADIFQPTQKAFIKWDGSEEKLVLQTKYEGPAEEMVWIVPVPSEPKVEKGDPNIFEELSIETRRSRLSYTRFWRLERLTSVAPAAASLGPPNVVEWRRRIGDYDVVLLRPVGEENVIQWLNSNQFGVPDEAVPILNDYISNRWWMVAAKIHRDALTDFTREKLSKGLLHPLEFTFKSSKCIYPLRLTSLVAGPVEELIYIEGPTHYEPATLQSNNWEIDIFGGPGWTPKVHSFSEVQDTINIVEGRTKTYFKRYLTKLRRVFKPEEMMDDIIFEKTDYAKLFASGDPSRIGQAATQYGRHRDPNGIPHLLKSLSPKFLDEVRPAKEDYSQRFAPSAGSLTHRGLAMQEMDCKHLRSCIWALGEIAVEHKVYPAIEETLLLCAKHQSQLIRMEAYIALIKLGSKKLGPIMLNRFTQAFSGDISLDVPSWTRRIEDNILIAEMIIIADWIERLGSSQQKDAFIEALTNIIPRLPVDLDQETIWFLGENRSPTSLIPWLVLRATLSKDPLLIKPLENYRAKYPDTSSKQIDFLLKAEALCGSSDAISKAALRIIEDQNQILPENAERTPSGDMFLPFTTGPDKRRYSLRGWILRMIKQDYKKSYEIPSNIHDTIIRTALSENKLNDWYVLYLLAQIEELKYQDTDRILSIWNKKDAKKQLVAVDVLWLWNDSKTLLELRKQCKDQTVIDEINRALESIK